MDSGVVAGIGCGVAVVQLAIALVDLRRAGYMLRLAEDESKRPGGVHIWTPRDSE